ncbi:diguanylate cyclase [Edaphobacter paludis]|uniref:diguanylate cyclase n=1 Tax=Edaphobacter paludis TaxID=3035702 RepID=A0AAU7D6D1_9BACT
MRILIAEDDTTQRCLLQALLQKWGHEVVTAASGSEAWSELCSANPPLLAILDWMMPGMDGLSICRDLRQRVDHPYVYVVLLTGKGKKRDLVEAFEAGADDYLAKPFHAAELCMRVKTGVRILNLQDQLISASTYDSLTGILNRGAILSVLNRELVRVGRDGGSVGVILADLDHFKRINDEFGHLTGDLVLQQAAQSMRSLMRSYDSVGRYGGEEFLMVLPGMDADDVTARAEQIRGQVRRTMVMPNGEAVVSLSLGVSTADRLVQFEEVLQAADEALYRAKQKGRNRVEGSPTLSNPPSYLQGPLSGPSSLSTQHGSRAE